MNTLYERGCCTPLLLGHPIPTTIPGVTLVCSPHVNAIPPLCSIVPHGLIEHTPHLVSHANA